MQSQMHCYLGSASIVKDWWGNTANGPASEAKGSSWIKLIYTLPLCGWDPGP